MSIYGPIDCSNKQENLAGYATRTFVRKSRDAIVSLIESKVLLLDGTTHPTRDVSWKGHRLTGLADPVRPGDAVNKRYVDSALYYGALSIPHFLKLECGESDDSSGVVRDFPIRNTDQRFGIDRSRLFIQITPRHSVGNPVHLSVTRVRLDASFLHLRVSIGSSWSGKLTLFARIDVINDKVERIDYMNNGSDTY